MYIEFINFSLKYDVVTLDDANSRMRRALCYIASLHALRNRFVRDIEENKEATLNSRVFIQCLDNIIHCTHYLLSIPEDYIEKEEGIQQPLPSNSHSSNNNISMNISDTLMGVISTTNSINILNMTPKLHLGVAKYTPKGSLSTPLPIPIAPATPPPSSFLSTANMLAAINAAAAAAAEAAKTSRPVNPYPPTKPPFPVANTTGSILVGKSSSTSTGASTELPLKTSRSNNHYTVGDGYRDRGRLLNRRLVHGVDNLLNKKYSLGNDLNAFGNRFFNASAERNYFAGLGVKF